MGVKTVRNTVVLALVLALCAPALASAQLTRGVVSGTARDASGGVLPGVTVTVTNPATNLVRSVVTDGLGFYRVPALEPGTYTVRAELEGFKTVEFKDIQLVSSTEVTINPTLDVGGVGESITVVGRSESIELNKVSPTIGTTIAARQVTELPLSADRNPINVMGLAPGVSRVSGQGTFAANGQRSRNNNYMIDGSDNNDISVTISTSQIVPEVVAEVQVQTNSYSVEFGRNSGAQVNVVTKSGTNTFKGDAWDYYRTSELNTLTNIQKASGLTKPPKFTRHQAGFTLGGPIRKDRIFFFGMYQYDPQRPESSPGGTVRVPTAAGLAALSTVPLGSGQTAASRQAVLSQLNFLQDIHGQGLSYRNHATTLVNGVAIETAQTNINIKSPSTYHYVMGRVDVRPSSVDTITGRYYLNDRQDTNAISNCAFGALFCGNQDLVDTNIAASWARILGGNAVNEFRFSWVKRDLDFPENDPKSPTATISGLFTIGGASNFPQSRVTDTFQFSNTFTWTKGRHTVKLGADVRYNKAVNNSDFNSKGTFTFNNLQDYVNNFASVYQQALQTASWNSKQWMNSFYIQDDFRVMPDLTVNMGVRYEIAGVPLGMFGATDAESRAALVPGPSKMDKNNIAPRIGVNYAPRSDNRFLGDGKTVFRAGFGMGYDVIFYNLLTVNGSNFPRVNTAQLNNVQNLYPTLQQTGGSPVFNALNSWTNSPEDLRNPESKFWSASWGRELREYLIEVGYSGSRTANGINQIHANPAILTAEQAATVRSTLSQASIPSVQLRRVYPQYGNRTLIPGYVGPNGNDVNARSTYHGTYVSLNKRFRHGYQYGINYTFSRFESNNDASLGEAGTDGSSQRPQSMFDYDAEWSLSQFDVPHRVSLNYLWELPGPKTGVLGAIVGGWQLSGVTAWQSGRPFTIVTGVDSNGDGNTGSDRPNRNGTCGVTWNSNHSSFTNTGCYSVPLGSNNLPLANSLGNGNSPRNTERTAGSWNTDLSLMKRFRFWGTKQVQVRGDAFNLLNQDSYGLPVNNMSSVSFGQNTNNWGSRTVTVSAKFSF